MSSQNEAQVKAQYEKMSQPELMAEYNRIISIPNARTNVEALTQMSALMQVMKERGIVMPNSQGGAANQQSTRQGYQTQDSQSQSGGGPNVVSIVLGLAMLLGGIALSSGGDSVYYGLILVGLFTLVQGFFSS